MKEPKEYVKEVFGSIVDGYDARGYQISQYDIEAMIKQAQIDVWNEAIDEAYSKSEVKIQWDDGEGYSDSDIWLRDNDGCGVDIEVDKNSILKLKKQIMNDKLLFQIALKYVDKGYSYEQLKDGDDLYSSSITDEMKERCLDYYDDIKEQGTKWAREQLDK